MQSDRFECIRNWTEIELSALPSQEDDLYEFKGRDIKDDDLGNKISIAASAFWNSGGGLFFAGINGNGQIDGGIPESVGRQSRRDWVDQQIMKTEPQGQYWVRLIQAENASSSIQAGCVVLVIGFEEGLDLPYMAYDKKHYIRVGAHSNPANHFLVESLRSRRVMRTPLLRGILRRSERKSRVVELVVAVLNDSAALDVKISFEPFPKSLGKYFSDRFPLLIPFIDGLHPFSMELFFWGNRTETFGDQPVELTIECKDLLGRALTHRQIIDVKNSIDPMTIDDTDTEKVEKAIKGVSQKIDRLNHIFERFQTSNAQASEDEISD